MKKVIFGLLLMLSPITAAAQSAMSIDVAAPGQVAGWGIADVSFPTGDGVDAVHVWAYAQGQDEGWIFLGATAAPSFSRPDVAYIYGAQHTNSGWALSLPKSLPVGGTGPLHAGRYTVCAYVHSWLTDAFVAGQCRGDVVMFYDDLANNPVEQVAGMAASLDLVAQNGTLLYPQGWVAVDTNRFNPATVTNEFLLDDTGLGYGTFATVSAYRPDVCAVVYAGHCAPTRSSFSGVTPTDANWTGVQRGALGGIDISGLSPGWHFVRLAIYQPETYTNALAPWRWVRR